MSNYFLGSQKQYYQTLPFNVVIHSSEDDLCSAVPIRSHQHEALEINLMLEGEMIVSVEDRTYHIGAGDMVLCNPFDVHSAIWADRETGGRFVGFTVDLNRILKFKDSPLAEVGVSLVENRCRLEELIPRGESGIPEIILQLLPVYTEKSVANECRALCLIYQLFAELLDGQPLVPTQTRRKRNVDFMRRVSVFINESYSKDITTADAAAVLYMDVSQFCHTFKRHFGTTFRNHLCKYRCICAAEQYRGANMSVADIAVAVGFSDYCYFTKSFKKYIGQTPAVYFGKWHKDQKCRE